MSDRGMADELLFTIAYMLTSALGLYGEPAEYGVFRLIDSAARILDIMEAHDVSDPYIAGLKHCLDDEREAGMNSVRLRQSLERIVAEIAVELQKRT